jgi:hypothetical protein
VSTAGIAPSLAKDGANELAQVALAQPPEPIAPGDYQFWFTASDSGSGLANVKAQVDSAGTWVDSPVAPTRFLDGNGNTKLYGWKFAAAAYADPAVQKTVRVRALATDNAGRASPTAALSVTILPKRSDPIATSARESKLYAYGVGDHRAESLASGQGVDVFAGLQANHLRFVRNRFNAYLCGLNQVSGASCSDAAIANAYDGYVDAAAARGIQLQPILIDQGPNTVNYPCKAALANAPEEWCARVPTTATRRQAFGLWAGSMAKRYGPGGTFWQAHDGVPTTERVLPYRPILSWELWNEQNSNHKAYGANCDSNWTNCIFPPSTYAKTLVWVKSRIRLAQPNARIVLGGLATGGNQTYPYDEYPIYVADELYTLDSANGDDGWFDAVAIHPYADTPENAADKVDSLRFALNFYLYQDGIFDPFLPPPISKRDFRLVQIWPNEIGWAVNDGTLDADVPYVVSSEEQQRTRTGQLLEILRQNRAAWNIGPISWFSLRDNAKEFATFWGDRTGMVGRRWGGATGAGTTLVAGSGVFDGVARPVFHTLRMAGFNASALNLPPQH